MVRPTYSSDAYTNFRAVWEERQQNLEEIYGDEGRAGVIELMLEELEAARLDELMEDVPLSEAPEVTGFSIDTIRRAVKSDKVRKVSTPAGVGVRAADLPFRPGRAHPAALRRRLYGGNRHQDPSTTDVTSARLEPVED